MGLLGGSVVKKLSANVGDAGLIPGSRTSHGEEKGDSLQYSCLRNPMDREAWQVIVCGGHKELDRTEHTL